MANLITGIDSIDHGLIPRPEQSEPSEEQSEADSSYEEGRNDEDLPPESD